MKRVLDLQSIHSDGPLPDQGRSTISVDFCGGGGWSTISVRLCGGGSSTLPI
jgi:hypothetical protein